MGREESNVRFDRVASDEQPIKMTWQTPKQNSVPCSRDARARDLLLRVSLSLSLLLPAVRHRCHCSSCIHMRRLPVSLSVIRNSNRCPSMHFSTTTTTTTTTTTQTSRTIAAQNEPFSSALRDMCVSLFVPPSPPSSPTSSPLACAYSDGFDRTGDRAQGFIRNSPCSPVKGLNIVFTKR